MPSLTSLVEDCLRAAKKIDGYLEEHNVDYPSIAEDTLAQLPPPLQSERETLVNSSHLLQRLAQGTDGLYWQMLFTFVDQFSLQAVYVYRLMDYVPLEGSTTFSAIAQAAGLSESLVERVMRHAMANAIFTETTPGQVMHTAASRALALDADLRAAVGMMTCDVAPATARTIEAIERWPGSGEPQETAFALQNELGVPIFETLAKDPERGQRFGAAMRYYGRAESSNLRWLIQSFDWGQIDRVGAVMIDVGGGQGTVPRALAAATKHLRFIVQDLEGPVVAGREALPSELRGRVEFMHHDFFAAQPVKGADVYFFRWILHNWSEDYCLKILRALIPALKPGARVMVYEHILKEGPETTFTEKRSRDNDLIMLALFNATERTWSGWQATFHAADPHFVLLPPNYQKGSAFCLIQAVWTP